MLLLPCTESRGIVSPLGDSGPRGTHLARPSAVDPLGAEQTGLGGEVLGLRAGQAGEVRGAEVDSAVDAARAHDGGVNPPRR